MYLIGVTGHSGSGKSEFGKILSQTNPKIGVFTLDTLWFHVVYENKERMVGHFGKKIFDNDGILDFHHYCASPESEVDLCFVWIKPIMMKYFRKHIKELSDIYDIVIVDFLALPDTPIWEECNSRVFIDTDMEKRHAILTSRDWMPCTLEQAVIRDAQIAHHWKAIGKRFVVLYNDYTRKFRTDVLELYGEIQKELLR